MLNPGTGRVVRALALGAVCAVAAACADAGIVELKKGGPEPVSRRAPVAFPKYRGPKTRIAVLPLGLSKRAAKRYPKLVNRQVGLGLHQMIVSTLAETNRFRFVEIRKEVVERLMRQLYLGQSDLVDPETALRIGRLKQPSAVIYGEVFDFGVGTRERIRGVSMVLSRVTRIGIQIRRVDPETHEYIPASGIGEAVHTTRRLFPSGSGTPFDETTVGQASRKAIRRAVLQLLGRLE
jgi:curli biogenesis system outer membrane secretion channel CsgG